MLNIFKMKKLVNKLKEIGIPYELIELQLFDLYRNGIITYLTMKILDNGLLFSNLCIELEKLKVEEADQLIKVIENKYEEDE